MRQSQLLTVPYPLKGLDEARSFREQPPGTTRDVVNMRPFDPQSGRARGGQRGGLSKYLGTQISGTNRVQDMNQVVTVQTGAAALTSLQIRTITRVAICNGRFRVFTTAAVSSPTGVSDPDFSTTQPVIFSSPLFGVLYFADGANYKKYTASTNTIAAWSASAGTVPADGANKPRLIELWRGRIVLSGIKSDPHNWFMSAVGNALDWDYEPDTEVETQAIAGNNSEVGLIGQPINTMVPYSTDVLLFGCDSTIWAMTGDPMSGGRLDQVSNITGMAWGRPWCQDPNGVLYFVGSRGGFFKMTGNSSPERLSANRIDEQLANIDMNNSIVRLAWNDREIGVNIWVTPLNSVTAEHYFYDVRTDSFWKDRYGNELHSPVAIHTFDGDSPEDREILLGGQDGYVRKLTTGGLSDDGTAISSHVFLGPLQIEGGQIPFVLTELQAFLSEGSDDVSYDVFVGESAEHALSASATRAGALLQQLTGTNRLILEDATGFLLVEGSTSDHTGTFQDIRSTVVNPRTRGFAAYVKLSQTADGQGWAMEALQARLSAIQTSKGRRL